MCATSKQLDEREILVHDGDACSLGFARAREMGPRTAHEDLALVRGERAADHLHQGRLAGTVVSDHRDDLVRVHVEVDLREGLHVAE